MNSQLLRDIAKLLFADNKGLLAMDECNGTCNKRFEKMGIPQNVEARRAYREMIVTTRGLSEAIGGAILYDETIRQKTKDGILFIKALIDAGALGVGILVCARHSAAGIGALEVAGDECAGGTECFVSPRTLQPGCAARRILCRDGEEMTGSKQNQEGNSGEGSEPGPGPYWRRMHRDWRFWVGALFMAAALAIYVLSGDLASIPHGRWLP